MIATQPSDDVNDFLGFMEHAMGPPTVQDRAGAAPDQIRQFVELVGLPLPRLYSGYLREFGESDGALRMADDTDVKVRTLLQFYAEQQVDPVELIPPNAVMIGVNGLSGERALLYPEAAAGRHAAASDIGEPTVVVCAYGEVDYTYAQTFRNHLYRQAFVRGRLRDGARLSLRRNDEELLPKARQLIEGLGFQAYWFSDNYQVCLERQNQEVLYIERTPGRTSLYGRFRKQETRNDLNALLIKQLDLQELTGAPLAGTMADRPFRLSGISLASLATGLEVPRC